METIQLMDKNLIVIPESITMALGLSAGDLISVEIDDGKIILEPVKETDQAYFWTEEWQNRIREGEEDIKAGRTRKVSAKDIEEGLKWLDE